MEGRASGLEFQAWSLPVWELQLGQWAQSGPSTDLEAPLLEAKLPVAAVGLVLAWILEVAATGRVSKVAEGSLSYLRGASEGPAEVGCNLWKARSSNLH